MQRIDIYIGSDLKGPRRGNGKVMYVFQTELKSGKKYESKPSIAEFEDATEANLALRAILDALRRIKYACEVVIHTQNKYVASAINKHLPEAWQENSWKNSKGKEVKDADLWSMILEEIEESGHKVTAEGGKHAFSAWMDWNIPIAVTFKDTFWEIIQNDPYLGST